MSTCFQHKEYGTWFHPSSRRWFQIDHVITSSRTSGLVMDVKSMVGYEHNTDHRCLRIKLRVPPKKCLGCYYRKPTGQQTARPAKLQVSKLSDSTVQDAFNAELHDLAADGLFDEGYTLFGRAVRRVGASQLGVVPNYKQPQWKIDNQAKLLELSEHKRAVARKHAESQEYKQACKYVKRETRRLINLWWTNKAKSIQEKVDAKEPNHQFAGYKELRSVLANRASQSRKLRDKNGVLLNTKGDRLKRWREHFKELLNVPALVTPSELDTITERVPDVSLEETPTFEETLVAVQRLRKGKAAGPDGIEPELIQALDASNLRIMHEYIVRVWEGIDPMPVEWRESFLVPLPKKGDLTLCKKWRGILLASVPGKVFARIINARLQQYCETHDILPESQCGFRAGRGTLDMVFSLRVAMEVAQYKSHPFHVLFVDLVKAYDSVSRAGLWTVLQKKGIPPRMLHLLAEYYSDKTAKVSVEGGLSDSFHLETGLGQGCCVAPLLFNMFLSAIFEAWRRRSGGGVQWLTRIDGTLLHRETMDKYGTWLECHFEELAYADDAALVSATLDQLRDKACAFQQHLKAWGVNLSVEKTKALTTEATTEKSFTVEEFDGFEDIELVQAFEYLGVIIHKSSSSDSAVRDRIDKARKCFWALDSSVWKVPQLSLATKISVFRACVLSVLLYGAEVWHPTYWVVKALDKFYHQCLRKVSHCGLRFQREHGLSNVALRSWLGVPGVMDLVRQARLRWLGHVGRLSDKRLPKQLLFGWLPEELGQARLPGRQNGKRLRDAFAADLTAVGIPLQGWLQFCNSEVGHQKWRRATRGAAFWHKPLQPKAGEAPPERKCTEAQLNAPAKKKPGFLERLSNASKTLQQKLLPQSQYLQWENAQGGRKEVISFFRDKVRRACAAHSAHNLEDLFVQVLGEVPEGWDQVCDLAVARIVLATAWKQQFLAKAEIPGSSHTGVTPRRIVRKRATSAWRVQQLVQATGNAEGRKEHQRIPFANH